MAGHEDMGQAGEAVTLLSDLQTEAITRDDKHGWTRTQVTEIPEHRDPDLLKGFEHAYFTPLSLTVKDTKTRKVVGAEISSGEIGRLYLKRVMSQALEAGGSKLLAKQVPWRKDALQFMDRGPAYYFAGESGGPFELVDITSCYASLYTRLTLDMTYRPETNPPLLGLGKGAFSDREEWMKLKSPRNAAWGSVLRRKGREWRHGVLIEDAYANQFFAPDLRGIILDAAHAIALEAKENFGALSWAADGGCFRPGEGQRFIEWLDLTWGMKAEVRAEGPGWMFGPTSYAIGPVTTADVKAGRAIQWPETDSLRRQGERQRSWLADVFNQRRES